MCKLRLLSKVFNVYVALGVVLPGIQSAMAPGLANAGAANLGPSRASTNMYDLD